MEKLLSDERDHVRDRELRVGRRGGNKESEGLREGVEKGTEREQRLGQIDTETERHSQADRCSD